MRPEILSKIEINSSAFRRLGLLIGGGLFAVLLTFGMHSQLPRSGPIPPFVFLGFGFSLFLGGGILAILGLAYGNLRSWLWLSIGVATALILSLFLFLPEVARVPDPDAFFGGVWDRIWFAMLFYVLSLLIFGFVSGLMAIVLWNRSKLMAFWALFSYGAMLATAAISANLVHFIRIVLYG